MQTKTPPNIDDYRVEDLYKLLPATNENVIPVRNRIKIYQMLFDILGLEISNDTMLMLATETQYELCVATAGAGKTTTANVKLVAEKIFRQSKLTPGSKLKGEQCLVLLYNNHNVGDFKCRHKAMIDQVNSAKTGLDKLDSELKVYTMHKFCKTWLEEFPMESGLLGFKQIDESLANSLMSTALKTACKKMSVKQDSVSSSDALKLYNLAKEKFLSDDQVTQTDEFKEMKVPREFIEIVFKMYTSLKKSKKYYDFTDALEKAYEMISTHQNVLDRIQRFYEYVVVDEVQDFTPLMFSILELIVGKKMSLLCIGDDDQSIYQFRGADIYNTLDFENKFDGSGEVYLLGTNRRCRENIVEVGRKILGMNQERFDKSIKSCRSDGEITYVPYSSVEGQVRNIVSRLQKMSPKEQKNTVICARERSDTMLLTQALADSGLIFHVLSGYHSYTHELYRHVFDVLRMLRRPLDLDCMLNLYKATPLKREQVAQILGYNDQKRTFTKEYDRHYHFAEIDYGNVGSSNSFREAIATLKNISEMLRADKPMNTYMYGLFELIKQFFWITKKEYYSTNKELDNIFEERVFAFFNSELCYSDFINKYDQTKELYRKYQDHGSGIAISTFHKLKGLEFDNVIIIGLDNENYPNFARIDMRDYDENTKRSLKETETRLFYVAVTRAKNTLCMYYKEDNPSIYIKRLLGMNTTSMSLAKNSTVLSEDYMLNLDNKPSYQILPTASELEPIIDKGEMNILPGISTTPEIQVNETTMLAQKIVTTKKMEQMKKQAENFTLDLPGDIVKDDIELADSLDFEFTSFDDLDLNATNGAISELPPVDLQLEGHASLVNPKPMLQFGEISVSSTSKESVLTKAIEERMPTLDSIKRTPLDAVLGRF